MRFIINIVLLLAFFCGGFYVGNKTAISYFKKNIEEVKEFVCGRN